jgi:hypothetical protein
VLPAMLMKVGGFAGDRVKPETLWRQQRPDVQDMWRKRAAAFVEELAARGYVITEQKAPKRREDTA